MILARSTSNCGRDFDCESLARQKSEIETARHHAQKEGG
jgi:hypothetical protein